MSDSNKEKILEEYPNPISIKCTRIILEQMKNCICKINNKNGEGTCFFCHIPNNNLLLMITNNHVLNEEILKNNNKIEVSLNDGNEKIELDLNNKKLYTSIEYDTTIIEVNEDIIKNYIDLDQSIFDEKKIIEIYMYFNILNIIQKNLKQQYHMV